MRFIALFLIALLPVFPALHAETKPERANHLMKALRFFGSGDYAAANDAMDRADAENEGSLQSRALFRKFIKQRAALGEIRPEYTQRIAAIIFRRTAKQEVAGARMDPQEIDTEESERLLDASRAHQRILELLSNGKLSAAIKPLYVDTTIGRLSVPPHKPKLIRPDFSSLTPLLPKAVVEDLRDSDVVFAFFRLGFPTNFYGGMTEGGAAAFPFPISPASRLPKRGICLFNTSGFFHHGTLPTVLILHEWFHTVEWMPWQGAVVGPYRIVGSLDAVSQDVRLADDIYSKYPGLVRAFEDKNVDWISWMLRSVIPATFDRWRANGVNTGWRHFAIRERAP